MKKDDVENMLTNMRIPEPENIVQPRDLKIPILSYRKSSKAGLWMLSLPLLVAVIIFLKTTIHVQSGYINWVPKVFGFIDDNIVLTYFIPLIFVGLPLLSLIINVLAICHFQPNKKAKELLVTIKYRPFNIVIVFISLAVLIFFLLPDKLSF